MLFSSVLQKDCNLNYIDKLKYILQADSFPKAHYQVVCGAKEMKKLQALSIIRLESSPIYRHFQWGLVLFLSSVESKQDLPSKSVVLLRSFMLLSTNTPTGFLPLPK